jgi:hypothetical protein
LEGQGAVKVIEKPAVPVKYRGLVVVACHAVIDVLVLNRFSVKAFADAANAVL